MSAQTVGTGPTVAHASYLGGSDMPSVVGVNPYASELDVWAEKTGRHVVEQTEPMELGDHFERPAIELYARRVGAASITFPGTLLDPTAAFLGATPDAIRDGRRGVQCKIVGTRQAHLWGDVLDGADAVPESVLIQVQWEARAIFRALGVRVEVSDVPAVIGTDLRTYEIPIDWKLIDCLEDVARDWWVRHVVADVMPLVGARDLDTLRALYPAATQDELARPTEDVVAAALAYDHAREMESEARRAKELHAAALCALIGERLGYQGEGVRTLWKPTAGRCDWKALAGHYRAVALERGADPEVLKKAARRFTGAPGRQIDVRIDEGKYK